MVELALEIYVVINRKKKMKRNMDFADTKFSVLAENMILNFIKPFIYSFSGTQQLLLFVPEFIAIDKLGY